MIGTKERDMGNGQSHRLDTNPTHDKSKTCRGWDVGRVGCSHRNTFCEGYPVLKRRVIVLLVKLIEGSQLIG